MAYILQCVQWSAVQPSGHCPQVPRYTVGIGILGSGDNVLLRSLACRIRAIIIPVQVEAS